MIISYKEIGGWCPFQAYGSFKIKDEDYSFYFRDRHQQSSMTIWKGLSSWTYKNRDNFLYYEFQKEPIGLDYHKDDFKLAKDIIQNHINKFYEK